MGSDLSKLDLLVIQIDGLHSGNDLVLVAAHSPRAADEFLFTVCLYKSRRENISQIVTNITAPPFANVNYNKITPISRIKRGVGARGRLKGSWPAERGGYPTTCVVSDSTQLQSR
jgi:hypothetical protein